MRLVKHFLQRARAAWLTLMAALALLSHAPLAQAEVFYGITVGGSIFSVDINGGPATDVFNFTISGTTGYTMATRPSDGVLFYFDTTGADPNLWRWDPATPTVAPVLVVWAPRCGSLTQPRQAY
jgi:hypothetical protein